MTARGNTRAAAGGVLFLMLGAGFLLGLVWSRTSAVRAEPTDPAALEAAEEAEEDGGREARRRGLIVERVGLSADQKVRVDSVVSHSRAMMRQLRADYRAGYGELIESARASIKAVLTPEQAAEYDALLSDFDRRRAEEAERGREGAPSEARERGGREGGARDNRDDDGRGGGRATWSYNF